MNYGEYTTVNAVRSQYLAANQSTDDALILSIIRQVSREMDDISNRRFYPVIDTLEYDMIPNYKRLVLADDLLELTTLTNGDGTTITDTQYKLYPLNTYPKFEVQLLLTQTSWQQPTSGEEWGALSVTGIWGYHPRYGDAWVQVDTTSASAAAAATSLPVTSGLSNHAGDLVMVDTEYLYVSAATSGSLTVTRGVNGSTAAVHVAAAPVYTWTVSSEIEMLARQASAAYYRLRSNPTNDTITIDGVTYATPKDVRQYLRRALETLSGTIRVGFA